MNVNNVIVIAKIVTNQQFFVHHVMKIYFCIKKKKNALMFVPILLNLVFKNYLIIIIN